MTSLEEQMRGTVFSVLDKSYAMVRGAGRGSLAEAAESCLAAMYDPGIDECTLVLEEPLSPAAPIDPTAKIHGGYRAIRFELSVPFEGVGFIAALAGVIAGKGVNILALSAFSCDYIMVKNEDLAVSLQALTGLGLRSA